MLSPLQGRRRMALPFVFALLISVVPLGSATALVPALGAEEPVSEVVYGPAGESQTRPAIEWNGTNYLAVWTDGRSGNNAGIWGSLLTSSGTPLSTTGMIISQDGAEPDVATDGTDFFVVWEDNGIKGAIVQADGAIAAPGIFTIYTEDAVQHSDPSVAFDGTNYLVAWSDYSADGDITAVRVDASGGVIDDVTPITITAASGSQYGPAVASDGTGWFVAWSDYGSDTAGDINGTDVGSDGAVADVGGLPLGGSAEGENSARLASNGTGYLVAWSRGTVERFIEGTRLDGDGAVLDASGIEIASGLNFPAIGEIGSNGDDYLATYHEYTGMEATSGNFATLVSDAGVADPVGIVLGPSIGGLGQIPAVASDGTDFMTLYGDADIYSAGVLADGTASVVDEIVSVSAATQPAGDIVWGDGYLAVWQDQLGGEAPKVFAGRLAPDGTALSGGGIPLSPSVESEVAPAVAWNGTAYLVIWIDYRNAGTVPDLVGVRLAPNGAVMDGTPIQIDVGPDSVDQIDIAAIGDDFFVVWSASNDVYGRVVQGDGTMPELKVPIAEEAGNQRSPHVAANGDLYLVTWTDDMIAPDGGLAAATFTPGAVDPLGPRMEITTNGYFPRPAVVASDGAGFLAAWSDGESGGDYDLWIKRFGANGGSLGAATPITGTDGNNERPDGLVFDGTHYVLYHRSNSDSPQEEDVARRIATDGSPVDATSFSVSGAEGGLLQAVASSGAGDAKFLYGRNALEEQYGSVMRLFTKGMDNTPPASVVKSPKAPFQKGKRFGVGWTRPAAKADVVYRKASSTGSFGAQKALKTATTSTKASFTGAPGDTYCFSSRSRSADGYLSSFGSQRCTAVPLDDKVLAAKGAWSRGSGKGYYLKTFSRSSAKGATLSRKVRGKRFALVATKCPGCGTVKVFFGKKLLKKVALGAPRTKKKQLIALGSVGSAKKAKLRIVVVSRGKPVRIEGLGVSAV